MIGKRYTLPSNCGWVTYSPNSNLSKITGNIVYFDRDYEIEILDYIETHHVYICEVSSGDQLDGSLGLVTPERLSLLDKTL